MLRAYFRGIPGMTLAAQKARADTDGVHRLARYEDIDKAIAECRSGDLIWVSDLTVLADNRDQLVTVLKRLSAAKYPIGIHESRTGRVSLPPHDGQHMAIEALSRWSSANKKFGLLTAAEAGSEGGKVSAKKRRKEKLPVVKAKSIWKDPALYHLNTDEITAKVNEAGRVAGFKAQWSKDALYRALGSRGVPAGPKMKPGN